jgi:predicted nucleotidyltransferase
LLADEGQQQPTLTNMIRPSKLLELNRDEVARLLRRYPISRAWIFGSVARGDDRPDSDLDLLVELKPGASFADYVDLDAAMASLLGCQVDVVTTKELESNELFRRRVNHQRRPLEVVG